MGPTKGRKYHRKIFTISYVQIFRMRNFIERTHLRKKNYIPKIQTFASKL